MKKKAPGDNPSLFAQRAARSQRRREEIVRYESEFPRKCYRLLLAMQIITPLLFAGLDLLERSRLGGDAVSWARIMQSGFWPTLVIGLPLLVLGGVLWQQEHTGKRNEGERLYLVGSAVTLLFLLLFGGGWLLLGA